MKVEITGEYKNSIVEKYGLMLNTITVRKVNGTIVVLDRDSSEYELDNGVADVVFAGTYIWNDETGIPDYLENVSEFDGAELLDYEIEDDAPEDYDLSFKIGQKISAW